MPNAMNEPRKIVVPLVHVGVADEQEKNVSETARTAEYATVKSSYRTALQNSVNLHFNPDGQIDLSGNCIFMYERYMVNVLSGIRRRFSATPLQKLYITHAMRRFDIIAIERGRLKVLKTELDNYCASTDQKTGKFKIGLVEETQFTVHTAYLVCEQDQLISDTDADIDFDGNPVESPYVYCRVIEGTIPVTDMGILMLMYAYYPIEVVMTTATLEFKYGSDFDISYSFSALVHPDENKRAIL